MHQVISVERPAMAISQDERDFFIDLGKRIAGLRKESHLTQVQLAEVLGISQAAMNAYEAGHRRVPVSALPLLAKTLGVSLEELIDGERRTASRRRGPAPKLQRHLERVSALPKPKQRFVIELLEAMLAQASR
jgi:transcriptional regulator with XRE-family HTH domain